jgi:ABC-type nitrate/sulfonate/bicarbonate transport system ATPase subunit
MIPGATNGEIVLSVKNVHLSRENDVVLDGVTFDVVDRIREGRITGQVVALLGPSGIGKTTLLRVIAGLDLPERGEVRGPGGARLSRRDVGVVFQDYPLLRHRTVEDNLIVAGRVGGLDPRKARSRVRELLSRVGLEDRASHYPGQLSGGQRQRAAIAQQLVLSRRVLLLDEPFSGLDPSALGEVCELVGEVANDDELNTVVVVTHDIRAALAVSDAIVLLGASGKKGGARVEATYDLVDLGLAWNSGDPRALEQEIVARFRRQKAA